MLKKWARCAARIVIGRYGYKSSFGANKQPDFDQNKIFNCQQTKSLPMNYLGSMTTFAIINKNQGLGLIWDSKMYSVFCFDFHTSYRVFSYKLQGGF